MPEGIISKTWPADLKILPLLQEFIEKLATEHGLGSLKAGQINLALEEIIVNIINHAYDNNSKKQIDVQTSWNSDAIRFKITDSGKPFNPLEAEKPDVTLGLEERSIGGLGLELVRQYTDSIEYQHHKNQNILTITIFKTSGHTAANK